MEKIVIGEKINGKKYGFRETCFGICQKADKIILVSKNDQYSLIGGGIEEGETHEQCLKREFMEESGYNINSISPLVTIDCFWLAGGKWPLESLANIYVVELGERTGMPTEEGHMVVEVEKNKAEGLLPLPYHKKAIEIYFEEMQKNN